MLDKDGVEVILIRCLDGPDEGDRYIRLDTFPAGWPPPETLRSVSGTYTRVAVSDLPEKAGQHPGIARGAQYKYAGEETP